MTAPDLRFSLQTQFSFPYRRVVLRLPENSGLPYVIEASGDLVNWLPVATNANAWSHSQWFHYHPARPAEFFRTRWVEETAP